MDNKIGWIHHHHHKHDLPNTALILSHTNITGQIPSYSTIETNKFLDLSLNKLNRTLHIVSSK